MTDGEFQIFSSIISEFMFRMFGFGPSKFVCDDFAKKVIAEAETVKATITLP